MTNSIGFLAAILTTISFVPQVYQVHKTKKTQDLSLGMLFLFTSGVFLWLIYGTLLRAWPIIIANLVTFLLTLYILTMKIKLG